MESIYYEADPMHGDVVKTVAVEVPIGEGEEHGLLLDYEEEKDFFTKAEGKFLKIEDVKYDEVENSVTFTVTA